MKVFAFDPSTGKRGRMPIGYISCGPVQNPDKAKVKLPRRRFDALWTVATRAVSRTGEPITPGQFGQRAICFCMGEYQAGIDRTWHWVALLDHTSTQQ